MTEVLHGFKLSGYRSFDIEQAASPFRKINLFVGQNNSGKSNVLKFITEWYRNYVLSVGHAPSPHETFGSDENRQVIFRLGLPLEHEVFERVNSKAPHRGPHVKNFLQTSLFREGDTIFLPPKASPDLLQYSVNWLDQAIESAEAEIQTTWKFLEHAWSGNGPLVVHRRDVVSAFIGELEREAAAHFSDKIAVHSIPQVRFIKQGGLQDSGFVEAWDGSAAIHQLASLQNPGSETMLVSTLHRHRDKFQKITQFFREVVDNHEATLQVTYDRTTILVELGDRVTTLDKLGTGLHQLILIAIATTYIDNSVFCIEEVEMNMHPTLQRRLLNYLQNKTTNQYFITTHSPALIDSHESASIFHVAHNGNHSILTPSVTLSERRAICDDLGFKASDILQANAIIWVEGPSDRIYINRLLALLTGGTLREGLHYSCVFYSGSIRAHFAVEDDWEGAASIRENELTRLLALLPINRNAIMLADSDLTREDEVVTDPHKIRLHKEFQQHAAGFYWQTQGRTIENYIRKDLFDGCKSRIHSKSSFDPFLDRFSNVPVRLNRKNEIVSADKVGIAMEVCKDSHPFDAESDVMERGREMAELIAKWNCIAISELELH